MLAHIEEDIETLADLCTCEPREAANEWAHDSWHLSTEARTRLSSTYRALLTPSLPNSTLDELEEDGIDVGALFLHDDENERVTLSDATELAAAASLIGCNGLTARLLFMPNVPKGSRRQSAPGIDVLGLYFEEDDAESLSESDRLIICSVKYTLTDARRLVRRLQDSLALPDLAGPYLMSQLRLTSGRLTEQGAAAPGRIFAFLGPARRSQWTIVACGVTNETLAGEFEAAVQTSLGTPEVDSRMRHLVIDRLSELPQEI